MYDSDEILRNLSANEEIAKKLFEIEVEILSLGDFKGLFEKLLFLIEQKFGIPHVWISIIKENEVLNLITAFETSHVLKERLNLVEKNVFLDLIKDTKFPTLVNEDLTTFYRLLPENRKYFIKSLAVAPLVLDGEVVGSLNLGDHSELRFQPTMDSFFLTQLSVKTSICLSNVTAHERLRYLATRDALTSLLNRREMEIALEREFSRAKRYGTPLALLFIDCDDFKAVNDTYGHACGDALLQYLADHLTKMTRRDDIPFRFAGDEFVIILPNQTSEKALGIFHRFRDFFREHPMNYGDTTVTVSISCGVASTEDPHITSAADLLKKADKRLYRVKKQKAAKGSP